MRGLDRLRAVSGDAGCHVPQPCELHRALPEAPFADGRDRRPEARSGKALLRASCELPRRIALVAPSARERRGAALCVVVHLATIIYAVRVVSRARRSSRTRGSVGWFAFYSLFVLAVTVRADRPARVCFEWLAGAAVQEIFLHWILRAPRLVRDERVSRSYMRQHSSYWAFMVHRISGIALALFLPLHFWTLGNALQGSAAWTEAAARQARRMADRGRACRAPGRRSAGARARVPALARLAEEPGGGGRRGARAGVGLAFALAL